MKKWLILLLVALLASPVVAERPRLRGPSKPKRIIRIDMEPHRHHHRYYQLKRYSKRPSRIHSPSCQTIIVVQAPKVKTQKVEPKPRMAPVSQHKTIFINSKPRQRIQQVKSRLQILKESKAKVRS